MARRNKRVSIRSTSLTVMVILSAALFLTLVALVACRRDVFPRNPQSPRNTVSSPTIVVPSTMWSSWPALTAAASDSSSTTTRASPPGASHGGPSMNRMGNDRPPSSARRLGR